jgi:hypothetical protein
VIESFENFGILVEYNSKFKDNVKIEELEECLLIISVFNPEKGKLTLLALFIYQLVMRSEFFEDENKETSVV